MCKPNERESDGVCVVLCVCVWIEHSIVLMLHENECVSECDGHLIYLKPEIVFSENFGQLGGDITKHQVSDKLANSFSN